MPNLRASRFTEDVFAYDETKNGWSLAASADEIKNKYPYTSLSDEGILKIRLHTPDDQGAWVDDLIGLSRTWLRSLPSDSNREMAAKLLRTANLLLDQRATARHNWNESSEEKATPPNKDSILTPDDLQIIKQLITPTGS